MLLVLLSLGADVDWLIRTPSTTASVKQECWPEYATPTSGTPCGLALSNGLVARRFVTTPAFGTIDWLLNATVERGGTQSMYRAVAPEASVRIHGVNFSVGGLRSTSTLRAYCNRSSFFDTLTGPNSSDGAFVYETHRVGAPKAPFPWKPGTRGSPSDLSWPPKGVTLEVDLRAAALPQLLLTLHYELYDGAPLLSKWLEIKASASSTQDVVVEKVAVELFAAAAHFGAYVQHGSPIAPGSGFTGASAAGSVAERPLLAAQTDQAHGASCEWQDDYRNSADPVPGCPQCQDEGAVEPLLNCSYTLGPGAHVNANESFVSFRALLLATDSSELARHALSRHRITKLLAPHTTENPIFFHATDVSAKGFKTAIDQMADIGFEMLIFSFGSGSGGTRTHTAARPPPACLSPA